MVEGTEGVQRMRRRGSLTAEAILALFAAAVTLPAAVSLCASLASIAKFDEQLQDELALQQLQRILMISYDIEAEERELRFTYQGQDRRLLQVNDHVRGYRRRIFQRRRRYGADRIPPGRDHL